MIAGGGIGGITAALCLAKYGNKVDDKYVIIEATVVNIIPMICDEYDYTNLMLDFGDKEELVSINRVFFKKHLNFDNVL